MSSNSADSQLLSDLTVDSDPETTIVESLCMNCHKNGTTRLMIANLRFFNDVLVSSFSCDHCGFSNNSIDPVGEIKPMGKRFTITIKNENDLNRKVARPSHCSIKLSDLGIFPSREGAITTVEGLFNNIIQNIQLLQPERKKKDPELAEKLDELILKLQKMLQLESPFSFVLDDPSGNAIIENPSAPLADPCVITENYSRTHEQNAQLGYAPDDEEDDKKLRSKIDGSEPAFIPEEIMHFDSICPACGCACSQNMKSVNIPYFKEVILMALSCDKCGFRDSEVKAGGGIEPKGRRWTLKINSVSDLKRDVLKAETANVLIPEIKIEALRGTLSDRFTTVEGLFTAIYDHLSEGNPFIYGDSSENSEEKVKLREVLAKLKKVADGENYGVTLIIDDPAGNSFIQNPFEPEADPNLIYEDYDRTSEHNDDLGITGMNTRDFETIPIPEESEDNQFLT